MYDTTFKDSFDSAKTWIQDLKDNANISDILIAIVGNKCDLEDKLEVTTEEAHQFAKQVSADIIKETSAKDNSGINELFMEIAKKLYSKAKKQEETDLADNKKPVSTRLEGRNHRSETTTKKKGCCK